jgi:hypothetical protein
MDLENPNIMNKITSIFTLAFLLLAFSLVAGASPVNVTFNGPVTTGSGQVGTLYDSLLGVTVYAGEYNLTVNGVLFTVPCITPEFEIVSGETWTANVDPIVGGVTFEDGTGVSLQNLTEQVWLYNQMDASSDPNANYNGAIWDLTKPGTFTESGVSTDLTTANTWWITHMLKASVTSTIAAELAYDTNYKLLVPVAGSQSNVCDAVVAGCNDYPQVFLGSVGNQGSQTPEPGTMSMLGSALVFLGSMSKKFLRSKA